MDKDTLERLLMDRALGGLPPDAQDLLADYLDGDADARRRAEQFERAAAAARQVLGQDVPAALPPFPAIRVQKIEQARRQLAWLRNVASVAAALVIGVGLGAALFGQAATVLPPVEPTPRPIVARPEAGAALLAAGDFWSISRLREQARDSKRAESTGLIWNSAVRRPRLGGE